MRAAEALDAADRLPVRPLSALVGVGRGIVVVAPHPDDESLGCGGLIALARRRDIPVRIVIVSDGTGSHPNSLVYPSSRLRALREHEALAAAGVLGVARRHVIFLRLPDRAVPHAGPRAARATRLIAAEMRAVRATAVMVTWGQDPHCDHLAAAALAGRAARALRTPVYAYPVWGWTLPADCEVGDRPTGFRLAVGPAQAAKRRAIRAHRSQMTPLIRDDPAGFMLDPARRERFEARTHEIFMRQAR